MKNRKANRLKGYDYSKNNLYFVTICVQDRVCCFGSVIPIKTANHLEQHLTDENAVMNLNSLGIIVQKQIEWLSQQYPYIDLHNYVIMPNHIHLLIEIDSKRIANKEVKIKSLSSLIGAFKTTSSKLIHESGYLGFSWQRSFHNHIIREEKAYQNISRYIDLNPQKWYQDTFLESK